MSVPQWNADIITPEEEGSGTKVLDGNQVVQPTLEGGTNITISDGTISATGGGAEYTAGEGIVISDENAISITETVRSGAALGATSVQPAALNDYATTSALTSGLASKQDTISDLSTIRSGAAAGATAIQPSDLATVATTGNYSDLNGKPTIPTVDQTYNSASTNAQSGVAVASAIAAIPSEVTTASGHFDLEGSVPVTVNYTGTPHVIPGSQTLSNPVLTDIGQGFAVNFSLEGLSTLDANESATLTIPSNAPSFANFDVFYSDSSSAAGGPPLTSSPALPNSESIASAGNYTLTGTNPVPSYGAYVGMFLMLSVESDRSAMKEWASTLTINWPAQTVDGYETTIPSADKLVPSSTSTDAGKILTVNAQGAAAWGMLGSVTSIQQVNALPATPDANTLYLIPEA